MLGTYALSAGYYDAYYLKAQQVRTLIKQDFDAALREVDVIACPTSPTTAFRIGEKADDPLRCTCPTSSPCRSTWRASAGCRCRAASTAGLPIGLQLIAGAFAETRLLRAAYAYEQATEWHARKPALPD